MKNFTPEVSTKNIKTKWYNLEDKLQPTLPRVWTSNSVGVRARFESMSFVVNILACKLKIVNNRNWKKT